MASSERSKASAEDSAQRRVKKSAVLSKVAAVKAARLDSVVLPVAAACGVVWWFGGWVWVWVWGWEGGEVRSRKWVWDDGRRARLGMAWLDDLGLPSLHLTSPHLTS